MHKDVAGYWNQMRQPPNFQAQRLLVMVSDQGAGSKFLTSCLAFSKAVVIPDFDLATKRLSGEMNPEDLRSCLLQRTLGPDSRQWKDFGIVDRNFWGFAEIRYYDFDPRCAGLLTWGSLVGPLTHSDDKWLILMMHSWDVASRVSQIWPRSTMLFIDNAQEFMSLYRPHYLHDGIFGGKIDPRINIFWRNCRSANWPLWPPRSQQEFDALPSWIRDEIQNSFNNELVNYFNDPVLESQQTLIDLEKRNLLINRHRSLVWDAGCFLDQHRFNRNLRDLYDYLELPDYDQGLTTDFYLGWLTALKTSLQQQEIWQAQTPSF